MHSSSVTFSMLYHKMPSYYYKVITEFQINSGDQFARVPLSRQPVMQPRSMPISIALRFIKINLRYECVQKLYKVWID